MRLSTLKINKKTLFRDATLEQPRVIRAIKEGWEYEVKESYLLIVNLNLSLVNCQCNVYFQTNYMKLNSLGIKIFTTIKTSKLSRVK